MTDTKTRAFSPTSPVYHVGMQPGHEPHWFTLCGLHVVNLRKGTPRETGKRRLCGNCERLWRMEP